MACSRDEPTTSEMRHDWLMDRWVIVAPQRTARPIDFVRLPSQVLGQDSCPFCHGHEQETPEAVACYFHGQHATDELRWHVRVVPNKFPAVHCEAINGTAVHSNYASVGLDKIIHEAIRPAWMPSSQASPPSPHDSASPPATAVNLFQRRNLSGGHEVIIEGPQHYQSITQLDLPTTCLVFQAYRDRLQHWLGQRQVAYAVVFKNVGYEAGASLVHSHSQLIATDLLPTDVERTVRRMEMFHEQEGECLICRTLQDELLQQARIVEETPDFVAYCPFASRLPSLVTIASKHHQDRFEQLDDDALSQLAWLVHRLVRRIEHCYPDTAYNYVIHTAPRCQPASVTFHWRIELFPRISTVAGFEWGSECYINPLPPETAAKMLRLAGV